VPLPPLAPIERRAFDYSDLERGMAQLDLVLRQTRRSLDALVRATGDTVGRANRPREPVHSFESVKAEQPPRRPPADLDGDPGANQQDEQ